MLRVELMSGRTPEQLQQMVVRLTEVMVETVNAAPEAVHIVIDEVNADRWAVAGTLVSDQQKAAAAASGS
jgi:4-oxalocrotonate tautomerase